MGGWPKGAWAGSPSSPPPGESCTAVTPWSSRCPPPKGGADALPVGGGAAGIARGSWDSSEEPWRGALACAAGLRRIGSSRPEPLLKHRKGTRARLRDAPASGLSPYSSPQLFGANLCVCWTHSRCPARRVPSGRLVTDPDFTPALMSQASSSVVPAAAACQGSPAGADAGPLVEVGSCPSSLLWSVGPGDPSAGRPESRGARPSSVVRWVPCVPRVWALGSGPMGVARPHAQKANLKVPCCGALPGELGGGMGAGRGWGGTWWFWGVGRGYRAAGTAVGHGDP